VKLKSVEPSVLLDSVRDTGLRLRRRAEPHLTRSQLAAALDCTAQALLVVDAFGRVDLANAAAAKLLGLTPQQLRHAYIQDQLAALDCERSVLDQALAGVGTLDLCLADGRRARATLSKLSDEHGLPTHACVALELQDHAHQRPALEAAGRLLAEIAHDINNQLSATLNYVFILRRRLGSDAQLARHLEELQAAAWRAATQTAGLKLLGPKRNGNAELLNIGEVLETLEPVLRQVAGTSDLELQLSADLPGLRVPRAYLEQLLVMVTLSAIGRARMPGTVVLRTEPNRRGFGQTKRGLRVSWEFEPKSGLPHMLGLAGGARAHGTLRRAFKRCEARPGHDANRIWVDLGDG